LYSERVSVRLHGVASQEDNILEISEPPEGLMIQFRLNGTAEVGREVLVGKAPLLLTAGSFISGDLTETN
jgi:hypothetical protein